MSRALEDPFMLLLIGAIGVVLLVFPPTGLGPSTPTATTLASVALTDDDNGNALFATTDLRPGYAAVACLAVTADGSATGQVQLLAQLGAETGALASHLGLTVESGTGGGFGNCAGFVSQGTSFAGTLAELGASTGSDTGWQVDAAGSRTFRITATVADDAPQAASVSATLVWGLVQDPSASPSASASPLPPVSPTPPPASPTPSPSVSPTASPTSSPSASPTASPTSSPSASPTASPTTSPSVSATPSPSVSPTPSPSVSPTTTPSVSPTTPPRRPPTTAPPTGRPTVAPPTAPPAATPTIEPSVIPEPSSSDPLPPATPDASPPVESAGPAPSPGTPSTSPSPSASPAAAPPGGGDSGGGQGTGAGGGAAAPRGIAERFLLTAAGLAQHSGFPVLLLVGVFLFIALQNRLDSKDPKLALAPIHREPTLRFQPPPAPPYTRPGGRS